MEERVERMLRDKSKRLCLYPWELETIEIPAEKDVTRDLSHKVKCTLETFDRGTTSPTSIQRRRM